MAALPVFHVPPIEFTLKERPLGWAAHTATPSELLEVVNAEVVSPDEQGRVADVLDQLHEWILHQIAGFPPAGQLANFLVVIRHDLSGLAYVKDLSAVIGARPSRPVVAGEPLRQGDITSVEDFKFNVDVPDDVAVIALQSHRWRRAVYFDFGPLAEPPQPRIGPLAKIMAQQTAQLWRVDRKPEVPARTRIDAMADGFQRLRLLLEEHVEEEVKYQEVLEDHPWMMGLGKFSRFQRHPKLDDRNIPDFTGRRAADETDDIVELKQPFLTLFRHGGEFTAEFHDAWHQAERYLTFARDNRDYLRREKGMRFENPRCILLIGRKWTENEARLIRIKDQSNPLIQIMTYEELLAQATTVLSVMRTSLLSDQG